MDELLVGVFGLGSFLVLAYVLGRVWGSFMQGRGGQALRPLAPVIGGGAVAGDADRQWLVGSYAGRRVRLDVTRDHDSTLEKKDVFDITLLEVGGPANWKIDYRTTFGIDPERWQVMAQDQRLQERLRAGDVLGAVAPFGRASIVYSAREKSLLWRAPALTWVAPPPDELRRRLDVLVHIAAVSEQLAAAADLHA